MDSTWRKLFRNLQEDPFSVLYDLTDWALSHQRPQFTQLIGHYGARPDFLIVGAQRGGTTSLYHYLSAHPQISASVIKEIHYFDLYYGCGENWYKAHFAPPWWLNVRGALTGEATPYYLYTPAAAARVAALIPDVRLVVLLREPVRRAYSQYHMAVQQGTETYSFSEAVEREADRLQAERDTRLRQGPEPPPPFLRFARSLRRTARNLVRAFFPQAVLDSRERRILCPACAHLQPGTDLSKATSP